MRRIGFFALLTIALLLALSACGGKENTGPADTPAPPTEANAPAEGEGNDSVFPPTWTPSPVPPSPTARPTLAPEMLAASLTPPIGPTKPASAPDYCFEFDVLSEGTTHIKTGESVLIAWQPIEQYPDYEVSLWPPSGDAQIREVVQGGSYAFAGELFSVAGVYGWEVWPLDENGQHVCRGLSGEIVVSP